VTVLGDAFRANARDVMSRYPQQRSALLMVLHDAQNEVGFINDDVVREVAEMFGLAAADVEGVVTFYTMYKRKHPGKFLISVCRNLSCMINGADETIDAMREALGPPDTTTEDGVCSWETVECLATCHWAVAAQVNYLDVPYLTPERARKLVEDLRTGRDLDEILSELRATKSLQEARNATPQRSGGA
jgi:NADH-quinone oxidoreductase subunit E